MQTRNWNGELYTLSIVPMDYGVFPWMFLENGLEILQGRWHWSHDSKFAASSFVVIASWHKLQMWTIWHLDSHNSLWITTNILSGYMIYIFSPYTLYNYASRKHDRIDSKAGAPVRSTGLQSNRRVIADFSPIEISRVDMNLVRQTMVIIELPKKLSKTEYTYPMSICTLSFVSVLLLYLGWRPHPLTWQLSYSVFCLKGEVWESKWEVWGNSW